jgi:hypothetical protein
MGERFAILVCGGRDYDDRDHIFNTLCDVDAKRGPVTHVIHGGATGADSEAMMWAQMMASSPARSIVHAPFRADWRGQGKAAGPIRNQRMLDEGKPNLIIAFPGGRGTADMVIRAKSAGVEVIQIAARVQPNKSDET